MQLPEEPTSCTGYLVDQNNRGIRIWKDCLRPTYPSCPKPGPALLMTFPQAVVYPYKFLAVYTYHFFNSLFLLNVISP